MIKIKNKEDLTNYKWEVIECPSGEGCWCRSIAFKDEAIWETHPDEEAYIVPSGSVHKEVGEYIVNLHNSRLKRDNNEK